MKVIDIHIHGINSYDTKSGKEEDILKIADILGSYGISEFIPTIYPSTIEKMRVNMMAVKRAMERQYSAFSIQHSALILGVHLEGPFLNSSKCGALNKRAFIEATEYNFRQLIEGFEDIVRIITIAPEIKGAKRLIKKISDMGIIVSMGHTEATFSEAEDGFKAGAKGVTHIFNAMCAFHHRDPGIIGFALTNKDIYIEIIADPFHLHHKTLELIFRIKDSEKIIIVSDSVKDTKVGVKYRIRRGVKAITDRNGRLIGGSMTVIESSKRLIQMGFDEEIVKKCITTNPERYLSIN